MSDQDNQSEFDYQKEYECDFSIGIKQNKKTDYEVFKEWHDNWLKEEKENKPPE